MRVVSRVNVRCLSGIRDNKRYSQCLIFGIFVHFVECHMSQSLLFCRRFPTNCGSDSLFTHRPTRLQGTTNSRVRRVRIGVWVKQARQPACIAVQMRDLGLSLYRPTANPLVFHQKKISCSAVIDNINRKLSELNDDETTDCIACA